MIQTLKYLCRDDRRGQRGLRRAFNLSCNGFELWSYETAFLCDPRLFNSHSALHYFSLLRTLNSGLAASSCSCSLLSKFSNISGTVTMVSLGTCRFLWMRFHVSFTDVIKCRCPVRQCVKESDSRGWKMICNSVQMYLSPETVHCTPAAWSLLGLNSWTWLSALRPPSFFLICMSPISSGKN